MNAEERRVWHEFVAEVQAGPDAVEITAARALVIFAVEHALAACEERVEELRKARSDALRQITRTRAFWVQRAAEADVRAEAAEAALARVTRELRAFRKYAPDVVFDAVANVTDGVLALEEENTVMVLAERDVELSALRKVAEAAHNFIYSKDHRRTLAYLQEAVDAWIDAALDAARGGDG